MTRPCPACDSTGKHFPDPEREDYVVCPSCQGRGWYMVCLCCKEPSPWEDEPCDECSFDRNSWRTYCETHRETFFHEREEP